MLRKVSRERLWMSENYFSTFPSSFTHYLRALMWPASAMSWVGEENGKKEMYERNTTQSAHCCILLLKKGKRGDTKRPKIKNKMKGKNSYFVHGIILRKIVLVLAFVAEFLPLLNEHLDAEVEG